MKAPETWSRDRYGDWYDPPVVVPATPTVWPMNEEITEAVVDDDGAVTVDDDGKLVAKRRPKNPIGFSR